MQQILESNQLTRENFFSLFPSFDGTNSDEILSKVNEIRRELTAKAIHRKENEVDRVSRGESAWGKYGNGYNLFLKSIINLLGFNNFGDFLENLEKEKGSLYVVDLFAPDVLINNWDDMEGVCLTLKDFENNVGTDFRKLPTKINSYALSGDVNRTESFIRVKSFLDRNPNLVICSVGGPFQTPLEFDDIEYYFYNYFKILFKYLNILEENGVLVSQIPSAICMSFERNEDPTRREKKFKELFKIYSDLFELDKYFECNLAEDGISFRKRITSSEDN